MRRKTMAKILTFFMLVTLLFATLSLDSFVALTDQMLDTPQNSTSEQLPDDSDTSVEEPEENEEESDSIFGESDLDGFPKTYRDVANPAELEAALAEDVNAICITQDFLIDRTFYVKSNTIVYSESAVVLTRSPEFAGDVFVVGQDSENNLCSQAITLSLGGFNGVNLGEILINGNSENMTVDVVGTIVFICPSSQADLYDGLTVTNCKKVGNERTLNEIYKHTNPGNVGGAVAILAEKGTLNVYGGTYTNNVINTTGSSLYGGMFYSYATMNVYGGLFEGGSANRAGAIYCYRTLNLYAGVFKNNYASTSGGAIYLPASSSAKLYLGGEAELADKTLLFSGNSAKANGGAISASGRIIGQDVDFENNSADNGGAIYMVASYTTLNLTNATFKSNTATTNGGAIAIGGHGSISDTDLTLTDVVLEENGAKSGGAIHLGSESISVWKNVVINNNTSTASGAAIYATGATLTINDMQAQGNVATASGGVIYVTTGTTLTINDINAHENSAKTYAGVLYLGTDSIALIGNAVAKNNTAGSNGAVIYATGATLEINKLDAQNNVATGNGGVIYSKATTITAYNSNFSANSGKAGSAIYLDTDAVTSVYGSSFIGNSCYESNTGNAGAVYIYTGATNTLLHSCSFVENTSYGLGGGILANGKAIVELYNITAMENSALKGGFLYETVSGTQVTISGLTVSGNTATVGGPIIWGNTTNAKLFINKNNYVDLDVDGSLPSDYWSKAIANLLKVSEVSTAIPSYTDYNGEVVDGYWNAVLVKSFSELKAAINNNAQYIKIAGDITISETLRVTSDTLIFSTTPCLVTRVNAFKGSLFGVENGATLTLGLASSSTADLLTMECGESEEPAFVVASGSQMNVYGGVTIGNAIGLDGCLMMVEENATLNFFGGKFENNVSTGKGVIHNSGMVNVNGGNFSANTADKGGVFYNVGTLNIHGGTITQNTARQGGAIYNLGALAIDSDAVAGNSATDGGAIYVENGTLDLGGATIRGNTAENGGAIYAGNVNCSVNGGLLIENTATNGGAIYAENATLSIVGSTLESNFAQDGGAVYVQGGAITVSGVNATLNNAKNNGGAIYVNGAKVTTKGNTFNKNEADKGGAVYVVDGELNSANDVFKYGYVFEGGAIYAQRSEVAVSKSEFIGNTADYNGGAMALLEATAYINDETKFVSNSAVNDGGAIFAEKSKLTIYGTYFNTNTTKQNGGAIAAVSGTVAQIYTTQFNENEAKKNGGAIFASTTGTELTLQICQFTQNKATGNGGAVALSNKAVAYMYTIEATKNNANRGAYLYLTGAKTMATVKGVSVTSNTAKNGTFSYGDTAEAVLNVNKTEFVDTTSPDLTAKYWEAALYGTLKINTIYEEGPEYIEEGNEPAGDLASAFDVSSALELEMAIAAGRKIIRIVADFELDRTYYITYGVTIFSTARHTLTRATNFGGDMFVIGEHADGTNSMLKKADAHLTLGNPSSKTSSLLVIDGNKDKMEVDVVGSVMFICNGAVVDIYENISVINCHKEGNERAYGEGYKLSAPNRVGGSVAVIPFGTLNVYGGTFKNNSIRDEDASTEEGRNSTRGAVFYNESNLKIYGGLFENNQGARGAIVYNYGTIKIYGGSFISNHATISGGVYYSPNSSSTQLNIGYNSDTPILFKGNTAKTSGGVIYSTFLNGIVIYGNTTFEDNHVTNGSGGAIYTSSTFTIKNVVFSGNTAKTRGGAIAVTKTSETYTTRFVHLENCTLIGNSAATGGAISLYSGSDKYEFGCILTTNDCKFISNTATNGGAIAVERKSILTVNGTTFEDNVATGEAGAIYVVGESNTTINSSRIAGSTAGSHGGAICVRSATLTVEDTVIENSFSNSNGGAIYIAYTSSIERNALVNIIGSTIESNSADNGGAIYATRRAIENDTEVLTVSTSDFTNNSAKKLGGAVLLTASVEVFMSDVSFVANSVTSTSEGAGGAISALTCTLEIDGATFTKNTSKKSGGGISLASGANVTLNNVTASRNTARTSGGFVFSEGGNLAVHNSTINNNSANTGAGMYLYTGAMTSVYNTEFIANTTSDNGAGMFIYTGGTETIINGATFERNVGSFGGGMYISNKSIVGIYNVTGENNKASKGGFMYETTSGTVVTLANLTVSGNTATSGGNIIWGNTVNAVLYIDMAKYTDLDLIEELGESYWATAIEGSLTVHDATVNVPAAGKYTSYVEPVKNTSGKASAAVEEIFELGRNSSDGYINSTYDKFPVLDNSSNFMSRGTTVFDNINGGTVTVDTYVYPKYSTSDNMTVGEALMIYQAMLYKQAYPQEEVSIDISAYRFSVQTAVNINRNSRYFGYARSLPNQNYDQFGFVRVAYLLVSAAKMGIHVNVLGHREGYPVNSGSIPGTFESYFASFYNDYCDPAYVPYGTISDYLTYRYFAWTLSEGNKGGTDMMHTKLCAVSHYLDMNGVVHKNAVWTSSSNLDGIYGGGYNANWKLQTATIISDHEDIYRISTNYLRLMLEYSDQEGIIEFQNIMNVETTKQINLILAGRGNEIPESDRLVYIGTEQDDVFEMYFTPFGGDILSWSEIYNPYCKYLRKLYDSEDYILFTWNAAEYSGGFPLAQQMERMIIDAFHKNKNPNNKIYANMESFDPTTFDDLVVGVDIGFKSINEWPLGAIHNKDLQFSYVENGQRYYVSLLNSCNLHGGSMYFQSNSALVIKETSCSENSVFSIIAKYSTNTDLVSHTFTETEMEEATQTEHGNVYKVCSCCGHKEIIQTLHFGGEWIVEKIATPNENGIRYKKCLICDEIIETEEIKYQGSFINPDSITGTEFGKDTLVPISINKTPHTIEATIELSKDYQWRGGVIVGNYSAFEDENAINLEIYYNGNVRLFYITNGVRTDVVFNVDVRSSERVHLAVTVDGGYASLYVNGVFVQSVKVENELPVIDKDMKIGGDSRTIDPQIFKGKIYSVALFEDVRSEEEIHADMVYVSPTAPNVLSSTYFTSQDETSYVVVGSENTGSKFTQKDLFEVELAESTVSTIEMALMLPTSHANRAGVIFGNYTDGTTDTINLEVRENGKLRLFYVANGTKFDYTFTTDIRSDEPIHVAVVVDGMKVQLYINASLVEVMEIACEIPVVSGKFAIGGDYRLDNVQYFKGTIYSVNVFSDVRTVDELVADMLAVNANTEDLLSSTYFMSGNTTMQGSNGITLDSNVIGGTVCDFGNTPATFEAVIQLSPSYTARAGVLVSNNFKNSEIVSFEVYKNGKFRLYFRNGTTTVDCIFDTDVRSDAPIHVALTVDGTIASLYINGVLTEVKELAIAMPISTYGYHVGGDFRPGNTQYFKGIIYSVDLFDHVRSEEEIRGDMLSFNTQDGLIFSANYVSAVMGTQTSNHKNVKFVLVNEPTPTNDGLGKIVCSCCDKVLQLCNVPYKAETVSNNDLTNKDDVLKDGKYYIVEKSFAALPKTFEFSLKLSPYILDRGGVVLGNYDGYSNDRMNVEIYTNGNPRLWYKINGTSYSYIFDVDVRSEDIVHMTLTIDGLNASIYLNGELKQTITLSAHVPFDGSLFYAATDKRFASGQPFKGELYSVGLFADVRTAEEIKHDMILVTSDAQDLLFYEHFTATEGIQAKGPWAGKTVAFVGDSITAGTNCEGDTYWQLLQESLELGSAEVLATAGSCISSTSDYGNENDPLINRYNDIPEADLITIFMGTNDYGHDTPLGTIDDTSDVSFYGALNVIIPALQAKQPNAKIVFITPIHRYGFGINSATGEEHTFDSVPNGAGYTLEDYVNAIKAVCEKYNVSVIDLYTELELDPSAEETREYYMEDGLHPNTAGHRLISEYLEHAIELLAETGEK